jgi:predicted amidohydrolase
MLICEDFWHVSPPYLLWLDGADLIIVISSTPARKHGAEGVPDSAKRVELLSQTYASVFTNFMVQVNRVGYEDGYEFFGGSTIFGPMGNQIVKPTYYKQRLFTAELDLNQLQPARTLLPLLRDERSEMTARELRRILQSK